jgi:thiamine-phosphate pyrophosphorylase
VGVGGLSLRGYYAILDVVAGESGDPTRAADRAARLLAAHPCMLQVRAKGASAHDLVALARAVHPLATHAGVPLCVNDRLDVALAVGAEAVHLGQDDLPLAEARRLASERLVIGVSTHSLEQASAAIAGGADYIGFGPIFTTTSKTDPDPTVGLELLRRVVHAHPRTPIVAIGGIAPGDAPTIASAGASAAALISAIDTATDPAAAAQQVASAFAPPNPVRG